MWGASARGAECTKSTPDEIGATIDPSYFSWYDFPIDHEIGRDCAVVVKSVTDKSAKSQVCDYEFAKNSLITRGGAFRLIWP
jgi:hypothetical protein